MASGRVFFLCLMISAAGVVASLGARTPAEGNAFVAVFPPWWPPSQAVAAASDAGAVLDRGAFSFVIVVRSQRPGLGDRLRAAGALLLLNPLDLGGCGSSPSGNQNV